MNWNLLHFEQDNNPRSTEPLDNMLMSMNINLEFHWNTFFFSNSIDFTRCIGTHDLAFQVGENIQLNQFFFVLIHFHINQI